MEYTIYIPIKILQNLSSCLSYLNSLNLKKISWLPKYVPNIKRNISNIIIAGEIIAGEIRLISVKTFK